MHWRRKWQPTPVFLPGESQGWESLVGCRLGVAQNRTRLRRLSSSSSSFVIEGIDLPIWMSFFSLVQFSLSVMSDSVRPHRRLPTRLPRPQDSPGKNTGVGCHFLLQCRKVKSESEVTQSCPTLRDPMDCSLPGSSIHGIFQARVLEWGASAFSRNVPTNG